MRRARRGPLHPRLVGSRAVLLGLLALFLQGVQPALAAEKCFGRTPTIEGSNEADIIRGTPEADTIDGRNGADVVVGGGGADRICGGGGRDHLDGRGDLDRISGGGGNDLLIGGDELARIRGGPGENSCFQGVEGRTTECAPVIAAAGDISCDPESGTYNGGQGTANACRMRATSDLIVGTNVSAVLTLGDNQYEDGALAKFQESYDASWGRLKEITYPSPGNHEYETPDAAGYFAYFGDAAGDPDEGYYSFSHGGWHFVSLNSECGAVGGCSQGSPQERWLRSDLTRSRASCALAYWHHPRFSSGDHGNHTGVGAFWDALHAADGDIVLGGHDHNYERFAPQDASGAADPRGIREWVVGTGGKDQRAFGSVQANSTVRENSAFGVLLLALHPSSYAWLFDAVGRGFSDLGSGRCH